MGSIKWRRMENGNSNMISSMTFSEAEQSNLRVGASTAITLPFTAASHAAARFLRWRVGQFLGLV